MAGPLAGFTVVDLTRVLSGPYCTMVLADLGARVIKVEHPGKGDDTRHWGPPFLGKESAYFLSINRNKESVTRRLQAGRGPRGPRAVDRARRRVRRELPAGHDRARRVWMGRGARSVIPRLVYASISGYGQTGPRSDEAGYDAVMQAEGGLMSVTGDPDRPGLSARRGDHRHGRGLVLRAGHHRGAAGARAHRGTASASTSACSTPRRRCSPIRPRTGSRPARFRSGRATATRRSRRTKRSRPTDGEIVDRGRQRRDLEAVLRRRSGLPELAADPRFTTNKDRMENYDAMRPPIDRAFRTEDQRRVDRDRLNAAGVANGEVRDIGQMLNDPQLAARDMVADADASDRRRHARDRRADQVFGERGERAHAAAGARPAHRRGAWRDRLRRAKTIAALETETGGLDP